MTLEIQNETDREATSPDMDRRSFLFAGLTFPPLLALGMSACSGGKKIEVDRSTFDSLTHALEHVGTVRESNYRGGIVSLIFSDFHSPELQARNLAAVNQIGTLVPSMLVGIEGYSERHSDEWHEIGLRIQGVSETGSDPGPLSLPLDRGGASKIGAYGSLFARPNLIA